MPRKKRKRKPTRSKAQEPYPGWMWMLFGLAIGLSVAFAIYMKDRPPPVAAQAAREPASMSAPIVAEPAEVPAETPAPEPAEKEPRFTFYSMLPSFEVVVPEEDAVVSRDAPVAAVQDPGIYVLQAGSFADVADADRRRAELALLGVESRLQRVMIEDRTYHRVRIGPIADLAELNDIRDRLHRADIDVLRIKIGE